MAIDEVVGVDVRKHDIEEWTNTWIRILTQAHA